MGDDKKIIEPKKYPKGTIFLNRKLEEDYEAYDDGQIFKFLQEVFEAVDKNIDQLKNEYPTFTDTQFSKDDLLQIYRDVNKFTRTEEDNNILDTQIIKKYFNNNTLYPELNRVEKQREDIKNDKINIIFDTIYNVISSTFGDSEEQNQSTNAIATNIRIAENRKTFENRFIGRKKIIEEREEREKIEQGKIEEIRKKRREFETDINNYPICVRRFAKPNPIGKPSFYYIKALDTHVIKGTGELKDIIFLSSVEYANRYKKDPSDPTSEFDWELLGKELLIRTNFSLGNDLNPNTEAGRGILESPDNNSYTDGYYFNIKAGEYGRYSCTIPIPLSQGVVTGQDKTLESLKETYSDLINDPKNITGEEYLNLLQILAGKKETKTTVNDLFLANRNLYFSLYNALSPEEKKEVQSYTPNEDEVGRVVRYTPNNNEFYRWAYVVKKLKDDENFRNKVFNNLRRPNADFVDFQGLLWYKENTPKWFFEKYILKENTLRTPPTIDFITGPGFKDSDRESFTTDKQQFLPEIQNFLLSDENQRSLGLDIDVNDPSVEQYRARLDELQKKDTQIQQLQREYSEGMNDLKLFIFENIFGTASEIITNNSSIGVDVKVKNTKTITSNNESREEITGRTTALGMRITTFPTRTKYPKSNNASQQNLTQKDFNDIKRAAEYYKEYYYYQVITAKLYYNPLIPGTMSEKWKGGPVYEFAVRYSQTIKNWGQIGEWIGIGLQIIGLVAGFFGLTRPLSEPLMLAGETIAAISRIAQIVGYGLEAYATVEDDNQRAFGQTVNFIFSILIIKGQYLKKLPGFEAFSKKAGEIASKYSISTIGKKILREKLGEPIKGHKAHEYIFGKINPYIALYISYGNEKLTKNIANSIFISGVVSVAYTAEYELWKRSFTPLLQAVTDSGFNTPEYRANVQAFTEVSKTPEFKKLYDEWLKHTVNPTFKEEINSELGFSIEDAHKEIKALTKYIPSNINILEMNDEFFNERNNFKTLSKKFPIIMKTKF